MNNRITRTEYFASLKNLTSPSGRSVREIAEAAVELSASRKAAQAAANKRKPPSQKTRTVKVDYKSKFLQQLSLAGLPAPTHGDGCENPELVFALPRRWRFDFAWNERRVAVEYQGGTYHGKSGHSNVAGLERDYEKFTEAVLLGWKLILINAGTVRSGKALEWVERALKGEEVR